VYIVHFPDSAGLFTALMGRVNTVPPAGVISAYILSDAAEKDKVWDTIKENNKNAMMNELIFLLFIFCSPFMFW
jgi:hypothetical protein